MTLSKSLVGSLLLSSLLAALLISCGGDSKIQQTTTPSPSPSPTQSQSGEFLFLTEASGGQFQVVLGRFAGGSFGATPLNSCDTGGPAVYDLGSILLSSDANTAVFDMWGLTADKSATQRDIYFGGVLNRRALCFTQHVTNDPAVDFYPSFSADATKVVFASHRTAGSGGDIMVDDYLGNKQLTNLTNGGTLDRAHPVFSPDGKKIAFAAHDVGTDMVDIWIMNADGSNPANLTKSTDNAELNGYPSFSPDGKQIIFTRGNMTSGANIYSMNVNGTGMKPLTRSATDWDPFFISSSTIAFVSLRDGNMEIYSMNADGSGQTRLTNNTVYDGFSNDMYGLSISQNSFLTRIQNRTAMWRHR